MKCRSCEVKFMVPKLNDVLNFSKILFDELQLDITAL